ncbi:uncharacterized protein CLAFUR5_07586 [Fulvia fulva]|uniref:Uncharacterized protein n=1 Tax=Passalora fulva TaxID=5499 RepID=A0A9Q8PAD7_PASFU|nr:uncharacterized protein CLAFUR5_07586 [Fulvia fulva]UJO18845.1 hypothetical protein CLAFUR5_07586 [Fulvia fulva]WPV31400.1 hypothetical protein CLAFUW7_07459 [Fulvia fulva]
MLPRWSIPVNSLCRGRSRSAHPTWRWTGLILLCFAFVAGSYIFFHLARLSRGYYGPSALPSITHDIAESISPGQQRLVIILPVDSPSTNLCKLISSAVALGYPAPVLVNWHRDYHQDVNGVGPSQLGKITGVLEYLQWATGQEASEAGRLAENDLVLMLDAHDVWMQLPPEILISRYYSSNARANRRLAEEYRLQNPDVVRQTIITAAQKGCVAPRDTISDMHCNDVPESTLPADVFGFFTDYTFGRWRYMRPRFLNSGSFMGPAGDMLRYLERVKEKMDQDIQKMTSPDDLGGDQGIFAEVFGEQEVVRKRLLTRDGGRTEAREDPATAAIERFDFHIGLDYEQELFYPTCYSENGGAFVRVHNLSELSEESSLAGVSPPRLQDLPMNIATSARPLENLGDKDRKGWGEVPLYADLWTTSIPAVLHHNAWRHGEKERRVTWWHRTWAAFPL